MRTLGGLRLGLATELELMERDKDWFSSLILNEEASRQVCAFADHSWEGIVDDRQDVQLSGIQVCGAQRAASSCVYVCIHNHNRM